MDESLSGVKSVLQLQVDMDLVLSITLLDFCEGGRIVHVSHFELPFN